MKHIAYFHGYMDKNASLTPGQAKALVAGMFGVAGGTSAISGVMDQKYSDNPRGKGLGYLAGSTAVMMPGAVATGVNAALHPGMGAATLGTQVIGYILGRILSKKKKRGLIG